MIDDARFDDATAAWLLRTSDGDKRRAHVVVDGRTLHTPNIPDTNAFRGPSFHTAEWDPGFDPRGRRVAVIGPHSAHVTETLAHADVMLFACPSTLETRKTKRCRHRVTSPIAHITPTGIRTADGAEYVVDAIIYATGSRAKDGLPDDALVGTHGLTIQQAWRDEATAYLGVAVHGFPNYFLLHGPDSPVLSDRARYIDECLKTMKRHGSTRIEVGRSAQQQYAQRARKKPPKLAFDLANHQPHDVYDGSATITVGGDEHTVRARLTGHLDPIDGKYHWQGTIFGAKAELPKRPVMIATDSSTARAKITEQTPWGSYSIASVGAPPYEFT